MSNLYAVADEQGRILRMVTCPESQVGLQAGEREKVFPVDALGMTDETHYVAGGQFVKKASFNTEHAVDGLHIVFGSLPIGLTVSAGDDAIEVDNQPTEIRFELPGTYTIRLSGLVEYQDEELEVTING